MVVDVALDEGGMRVEPAGRAEHDRVVVVRGRHAGHGRVDEVDDHAVRPDASRDRRGVRVRVLPDGGMDDEHAPAAKGTGLHDAHAGQWCKVRTDGAPSHTRL